MDVELRNFGSFIEFFFLIGDFSFLCFWTFSPALGFDKIKIEGEGHGGWVDFVAASELVFED